MHTCKPHLLYPFICQWTLHRGACVFLNYSFFPDRCPRVGLQGHMATLVLVFWGTSTLFSIMAAPVYIPTSTPMLQKDSLFFIPSLTFVICRLFNDDHSDWCEGVPHWSFGLHFLIISGDEHLFMCFLIICMPSLEKCLFSLLPIFVLGCFFLFFSVVWAVFIFWKLSPCQ